MFHRMSKVNSVKINSLGSASLLQLGDSEYIHNVTHALAIHREKELFFGNEENPEVYSIFNRLYPLTSTSNPVIMQASSLHPIIKVNSVNVFVLSSSAALHIGNTGCIEADTRVKHIRQLEKGEEKNEQNIEEE